MLPHIIPDTVGVVDLGTSKGTQEDCQGKLVEVPHGLLDTKVVSGVRVGILVRQLRCGQASNRYDGATNWPWEGSNPNMLVLFNQFVSQVNQVLQSFKIYKRRRRSTMVCALKEDDFLPTFGNFHTSNPITCSMQKPSTRCL